MPTSTETGNILWAAEQLRNGAWVRRSVWDPGKAVCIRNGISKMRYWEFGPWWAWAPNVEDLLATDYYIVKE